MSTNPTKNQLVSRPPVVAVMGHIDHGKSTLLDYIRHTNTTTKEAGGITQHIRAYEAEIDIGSEKKKITFLDTPGHEAFFSIRERGARLADIAVVVISAEDGVKPQTLEALKSVNDGGVPFIVALNKIDKGGVNLDKAKQNLAEHNVFVEGWGGDVPLVPVSGKTGENVPELLEIIALQAELQNLQGDSAISAEGFVIESDLNPKQGISATLLIKNGTLQTGHFVATAGAYAPVRQIENFAGQSIKNATFSSPVKIVGWNTTPTVGNTFRTFAHKDEAVKFAETAEKQSAQQNQTSKTAEKYLTVVVKADTMGSLEALHYELGKLGDEKIAVRLVSASVGTVNENDLKTAAIKKSLVLGFNVSVDKGAEALALRDNLEIKNFKVIYELIDFIKERLVTERPVSLTETIVGNAKILRTFSKNKDKQVIGGRVEEGEIKSGLSVRIVRRGSEIGEGKVKEMQSQKIKVASVKDGEEFGMLIESKIELMEGDFLKAVVMAKV